MHLCFVVGTRPELIKLAPLILLAQASGELRTEVILTRQHDELLRGALEFFGISADLNLDMMERKKDSSLASLLGRGLLQLDDALAGRPSPHAVVAQGDTSSVLAAAIIAFSRRIPFAHVEAGLRSYDLDHPFPEEANRQLVARLARWHFAPTVGAAANLRSEGVPDEHVLVTGNTVVDAVQWTLMRLRKADAREKVSLRLASLGIDAAILEKCVLVTAHRRENFGAGMRNICEALRQLSAKYQDLHFIWPLHLNPNVQRMVTELLGNVPRVHLIPPLDHPTLIAVLDRALFALTDSGGIQEEVTCLEKPVLILRKVTERPEVLDCGLGQLVGAKMHAIISAVDSLLERPERARMAPTANPFGDGRASQRILQQLKTDLRGQKEPATRLEEPLRYQYS